MRVCFTLLYCVKGILSRDKYTLNCNLQLMLVKGIEWHYGKGQSNTDRDNISDYHGVG